MILSAGGYMHLSLSSCFDTKVAPCTIGGGK